MVQRLAALSVLSFTSFLVLAPPVRAADLYVGPTRGYHALSDAVAAARANDHIYIDPGTYTNDPVQTKVPLTIEGLGAGAVLNNTQPIDNRKGIIVTNAALTVRNLTFNGALVTEDDGNNGAGIRHQAGNLIVDNCTFSNNQDGILVNPIPGATVTITNSTFNGNGAGDGYSHAIYVNEVAQFTVSNSTFNGTKVGHDIKSRALATTVSNTYLDDGVTGTTSYAIDLPNGGVANLDNLKVVQGEKSENGIMIAYGAEGNLKANNSLTVTNSTFIDHLGTASVVAVDNFTSSVSVTLTNDSFQNIANPLKGRGEVKAAANPVTLRIPAVFSSLQSGGQSYFRIYNGGNAAGTVTLSLYDGSGALLTQWVSPTIAPGSSPQFGIATIESAATQNYAIPQYYAMTVQSQITGSFQHVLYRPSDGTLSDLSTCDSGQPTGTPRLTNVHSSLLSNGFPSSIVVYNTGSAAASAQLGIYDARNGSKLGSFTTPAIPALGQSILAVDSIEGALQIKPTSGMFHYNVKLENSFTGVLQHLVNNQRAGLITDMTAVCALNASGA